MMLIDLERHSFRVSPLVYALTKLRHLSPLLEAYIWWDFLEWTLEFLIQCHFTHRLHTDTLQLVAGSMVARHILGLIAMIIT